MNYYYKNSGLKKDDFGKNNEAKRYSIINKLQERYFNKKGASSTNIPNSNNLRKSINFKGKEKENGENDF